MLNRCECVRADILAKFLVYRFFAGNEAFLAGCFCLSNLSLLWLCFKGRRVPIEHRKLSGQYPDRSAGTPNYCQALRFFPKVAPSASTGEP
ncbi:MAG: hypothetical protein EAZ60_11935 [Oscillatoriales cyanobacterium]|nr:MAG: hypothetical protein EAZ60_11935 [Oscillatoriales cyanobacterium]